MTHEQFFKELDKLVEGFTPSDYLTTDSDLSTFESITEELESAFNESGEIIYYHKAMQYLSEHDNSLTESLEIAEEYGYTPGDLNSEILASLHNGQRIRDEWYSQEEEVTELIDQLNEGQ